MTDSKRGMNKKSQEKKKVQQAQINCQSYLQVYLTERAVGVKAAGGVNVALS